tara:strand:- start:2857 stop:3348 length:492 start_codon:yes stop_codon:yes gene_type:complete
LRKFQNSISNFFSWLSKTELVELDSVDINEDPIRSEYDNEFRTSYGRKIYGLKSNENIEGFICIAFSNEVPQTMKELDLMSKNAFHEKNGNIAIAYTVWSRKRGAGKETIFNTKKFIKEEFKDVSRFITLSPLTPIATHFHIKHGAKLININATSQNFEYEFN